MTDQQKEKMQELRAQGLGYRTIAKQMELSVGTVSSYFLRREKHKNDTFCLQCGLKLKQTKGHRQKKFCSDACRRKWWKNHAEQHKNLKAYYQKACVFCGNMFTSYGHANRKFCSRACYLNFIRGVSENDGRTEDQDNAITRPGDGL